MSKDKGFGPLIDHLRAKKIKASRVDDVSKIPKLRNAKSVNTKNKISADDNKIIDTILKNLINRGSSKPRKVKTLTGTIRDLFKDELDEKKIDWVFEKLRTSGHIAVKGESVSYNLPAASG